MGKPKKQTSHRKTGLRQSHLRVDLARRVNALLSKAGEKVKAFTTVRESGKKLKAAKAAPAKAKVAAK
jgi:ribosomal protein L32